MKIREDSEDLSRIVASHIAERITEKAQAGEKHQAIDTQHLVPWQPRAGGHDRQKWSDLSCRREVCAGAGNRVFTNPGL